MGKTLLLYMAAFLLLAAPAVLAESCSITADASSSVTKATTGTNVQVTSTLTASGSQEGSTCTATQVQLLSSGSNTGSQFVVSDPPSPYYYTGVAVSSSGTTKTFTASAGTADVYSFYVQTTYSGGSSSSTPQVIEFIDPSVLTVTGSPSSTSAGSFTFSVSVKAPANTSIATSYALSYDSSYFSASGDPTSQSSVSISAGATKAYQWSVSRSACFSGTKQVKFQLGDNPNAFVVTVTGPGCSTDNTVSSSTTATPTPAAATAAPTSITLPAGASPIPGATATPTPALGREIERKEQKMTAQGVADVAVSRTLVVNEVPGTTAGYRSTFTLVVENTGSMALRGVEFRERIPDDVATDASQLTFNPQPARFERGSIIAVWLLDIAPGEKRTLTYSVNKRLDSSVLAKFAAPSISAAAPTATATATPAVIATATPTASATPAPSAGQISWDNNALVTAIVIIAVVAAVAYYMLMRKKGKKK